MYVNYEYYAESYGGSLIPEASWNTLYVKVEARLGAYTFGRLQEPWPNEAMVALCEMAECLYKHEKRDGKVSENNDGYSVSYDTNKSIKEALYDIAYVYLANTGLMDMVVEE